MAESREDQPQWVSELDEPDWSEIDGAYGPATSVVDQIVAIAFGDDNAATSALNELSENINHQGTCYPATRPAVPFLLHALVAQESPSVRAGIIELLAGIVGGVALFVDGLEDAHIEDEHDDDEDEIVSHRRTSQHVWRGADLYEELLSHERDADVRMNTAYLLGMLVQLGPMYVPGDVPNGFDGVVAALLNRAAVETDDLALASVALALGGVVSHDARVRDPLRRLQQHAGQAASVMAALALVRSDSQQREEVAAADYLIATMERSDEIDTLLHPPGNDGERRRSFPWVCGRLRFELCHELCVWSLNDEQRMEKVLPALLCCVKAANGYTAEADVGPVLRWLWPERKIELEMVNGQANVRHPDLLKPDDITGIRRTVVEACYENRRIWDISIGNTDLAFMEVGLPTSRSGVRKLLKKSWWQDWRP